MFFILDWDGTLSDSTAKICACMRAAARDINLPELDDNTIKNIIGLGLREAVTTLYPGIEDDQIEALRKAYSEHFLERDQIPSPFFPNVLDTLENLKLQGNKLAIATGKSRHGLDRVLKNLSLDQYFDATRCADETASKPHPLMVQELLSEMGLRQDQAVMVGDTEWDLVMADNAGVRKIAVSYGAHSKERLLSFSPDMCVDDFSTILNWRF
jgi:phosphoglycolate phosphatase